MTEDNGSERVAVMTRLRPALAHKLRARAAREQRSQSQLVELLLAEALEQDKRPAATPAA